MRGLHASTYATVSATCPFGPLEVPNRKNNGSSASGNLKNYVGDTMFVCDLKSETLTFFAIFGPVERAERRGFGARFLGSGGHRGSKNFFSKKFFFT